MRKQQGFTLMELLIAIAIVGVLAAIAFPSYTAYIQRGYRAEARSALAEAQQFMERYYAANSRYTDGSGNPPDLPQRLQTVPEGAAEAQARYVLSVSDAKSNSYTLKAALGAGYQDPCGDFTLTHENVKGRSGEGMSVEDCWR